MDDASAHNGSTLKCQKYEHDHSIRTIDGCHLQQYRVLSTAVAEAAAEAAESITHLATLQRNMPETLASTAATTEEVRLLIVGIS